MVEALLRLYWGYWRRRSTIDAILPLINALGTCIAPQNTFLSDSSNHLFYDMHVYLICPHSMRLFVGLRSWAFQDGLMLV